VVKDVFDGATVTLKRTSGPSESAGFDLSALNFLLGRPFVEGEYVSAVQAMHKCELDGAESGAVRVGPPEALQPGVGPLCVGGPGVRVYNLQPGAIIHFDLNGTRYDLMAPPDETSYTFYVDPPLAAGTATVTQEICGVVSPPTVVPIEHRPAIASKPMLRTPLYDCARSVTVANICIGAEVQLFAQTPTGVGPISARKVCLADVDDFDVIPHLKVNNLVWAVEIGCALSSMESDHKIVDPHPPIVPPEIEDPVESGATAVTVKGVFPTASVCVYLLEKDLVTPIGYKPYAEGSATTVTLDRSVKTGDQLVATQAYCGLTTENGPSIKVVKPRPLAPVIKVPAPGSTNVAYDSLTVSWVDPGAGKEWAADTFDLEISDGGALVATQAALKTTSFQVSKLGAGTAHTVKVRGSNSTGFGPWGNCTFTTRAPKPNLTKFDPPTLSGENFPPYADVTLHVTLEIKGTLNLKVSDEKGNPLPGAVQVQYDTRVKDLTDFTCNDKGSLTAPVDLVALLDQYTFTAGSGQSAITIRCAGPLKGELVHIKASYSTPNRGKISSNVLDYQWTKDTVLLW
jgi:hypothetical protein